MGPVSFALATGAVSWPEPSEPFGAPESPPPNSNTTATTVARTATAATPPIAHLRFLLSFGASESEVTVVQLKWQPAHRRRIGNDRGPRSQPVVEPDPGLTTNRTRVRIRYAVGQSEHRGR